MAVSAYTDGPPLIEVTDIPEDGERRRIVGYFGVEGALDLVAALVEVLAATGHADTVEATVAEVLAASKRAGVR